MTTGSDQTTLKTMSTVPDLMELHESACDPRSTTPTKNPNEKERGNSDDECEFSDNSDDELITEVDWVQCAGQMGSLISQMTDLKKGIERCIVPNHKIFLNDAKEAAISCKNGNQAAKEHGLGSCKIQRRRSAHGRK